MTQDLIISNRELPSGTITFLFTDIEGSTQLWQKYPAAMEAALARHHVLLEQAIAAENGYVFQIIGDAFSAAFATAMDGVTAALMAQRALRDEEWGETGEIRVRMALHTGAAQVRAGDFTSGEYVSGITLSRAARVLSAGHGGQVLLSAATAELVREQLPADVELRDLGAHRLKDLVQPQQIFQVLAPDLPMEFAPLRTLDTAPNNLPIQLTSFVGREREMREVKRQLEETRLLTLTGVGGTGKTRLALQVAADCLDNFPQGVWLVELAALSDPALLADAVASIWELRKLPGRSTVDAIKGYLHNKNVLLVLDNCEHLIDACAQFADTLLHAAPHVKILATSREALGIAGETTYPVPSLSFPNTPHPTPASLSHFDAVRLFSERATAVQPHFQVTAENAASVAQICHRLDGIPLAIELAAARIKGLSVEQIAPRLDERFRLLTGGSRTALPRQRTLQAAIDWSYRLLSDPERVLMRRLAVFAGGWTLDAAEFVCAGNGVETDEILDLLSRLIDKSLVVAEASGAETRYHMLETIRQYAQEKLSDEGDAELLRDHHLEFFRLLAERAEPKLAGGEQLVWLDRVETEHDNLRAALTWAQAGGSVEAGLNAAADLLRFWIVRGYLHEGREVLEGLLADPQAADNIQAHANGLLVAGQLVMWLSDLAVARAYIEESRSLWLQLGPHGKKGLARANFYLSWIDWSVDGNHALARERFAENLKLYQEAGDQWGVAQSWHGIALAAEHQGDLTEAERAFRTSLEGFRRIGDTLRANNLILSLGTVAFRQGNYVEAGALIQEALTHYRRARERFDTDTALWMLGVIAIREGDYAQAQARYSECLAFDLEMGVTAQVPECFIGFAGIAVATQQLERAVQFLGGAEKQVEARGGWLEAFDQVERERLTQLLHATLDEREFKTAWAKGREMTPEQAMEVARLTDGTDL